MVRPWPRPLATKSLPLAAPVTPGRHTIWQRGGGGGWGRVATRRGARRHTDLPHHPELPKFSLRTATTLDHQSTRNLRQSRRDDVHVYACVCVLYCDSVKGRKGQRAVRNL